MWEQKNSGRKRQKSPPRPRGSKTLDGSSGLEIASGSPHHAEPFVQRRHPPAEPPEPSASKSRSVGRAPRPRPMLTRHEVAEWWNKSVRSVDRVIKSGKLRAYQI